MMAEHEAWVMIPKLDKDKTGCVIDMRPLVLCKNCKFRYKDEVSYVCVLTGNLRKADWFCADGERADT